jgi:hypothetical protein
MQNVMFLASWLGNFTFKVLSNLLWADLRHLEIHFLSYKFLLG